MAALFQGPRDITDTENPQNNQITCLIKGLATLTETTDGNMQDLILSDELSGISGLIYQKKGTDMATDNPSDFKNMTKNTCENYMSGYAQKLNNQFQTFLLNKGEGNKEILGKLKMDNLITQFISDNIIPPDEIEIKCFPDWQSSGEGKCKGMKRYIKNTPQNGAPKPVCDNIPKLPSGWSAGVEIDPTGLSAFTNYYFQDKTGVKYSPDNKKDIEYALTTSPAAVSSYIAEQISNLGPYYYTPSSPLKGGDQICDECCGEVMDFWPTIRKRSDVWWPKTECVSCIDDMCSSDAKLCRRTELLLPSSAIPDNYHAPSSQALPYDIQSKYQIDTT